MKFIESKQNTHIKKWRKLHTKKGRQATNQFWVEGEHLVYEALHSGWSLSDIVFSEQFIAPSPQWDQLVSSSQAQQWRMSADLFAYCSDTQTPQGIAAVATRPKQLPWPALIKKSRLVLILDRVQDPGNVGTMIRTADAAGADAVVLGDGCADPLSGKVLRSSQGSTFHLPIYEGDASTYLQDLRNQPQALVIGSTLERAIDYREINLSECSGCIALIIGNEGSGIQEQLLRLTDVQVKVPMWGKAESLNAAVCAGILLYEVKNSLTKSLTTHKK